MSYAFGRDSSSDRRVHRGYAIFSWYGDFQMLELSLQQLVLLCSVGLFTLAAAFCDYRARKIPNRLTLPMFGVGWVYQLSFFGFSGLADAGLAFLLGFGVLFILWMIGGGGGGDVKLMGALSVWVGFRMTLLVLVASTLIIAVSTVCILAGSLLIRGIWGTKKRYLAENAAKKSSQSFAGETAQDRRKRRVMAYAIPVAFATWAVMLWKLPLM